MQVIGDTDRTKIYTLSEFERKNQLESVLASECDLYNLLEIDDEDKELYKEYIKSKKRDYKKAHRNGRCKCKPHNFKQQRLISFRELVTYTCGKCDLVKVEKGYIIPRDTALRREFSNLLILIRQIIISEKNFESTPLEFFALWLGTSIFIIMILYFERMLSI